MSHARSPKCWPKILALVHVLWTLIQEIAVNWAERHTLHNPHDLDLLREKSSNLAGVPCIRWLLEKKGFPVHLNWDFFSPPLMLGALRLRGRFQERCAGNSSRSGRLLVIYWVVSQDKEGQIIHLECTHLHNLPSAGWEFFIWDGRLFWELAIKGGGEKVGCKNAPCHPAHPLSATPCHHCHPLPPSIATKLSSTPLTGPHCTGTFPCESTARKVAGDSLMLSTGGFQKYPDCIWLSHRSTLVVMISLSH